MLFLKFYGATRHRVHYFAINIRYPDRLTGEPITKTLAVLDTKSRATAKDLEAFLMEALDRFGISTQQLVCCVSDNSANMVKLVKDLDKAARVISAGNGDTDNASEVDDIEDATEATDTDNAFGAV